MSKKKEVSIDSWEKKFRAKKRWNKKHPIQAWFKNVGWFFRYRIWGILDDWRYEIKWGFQRMFRGYDDPHVWNFWAYNAELNIKVLKKLKKIKTGYPIILINKQEEKEWKLNWNKDGHALNKKYNKRWNDYMDTMIKGWEAIFKEDEVHLKTNGKYDHIKSEKKRKELFKLFEEGMKLYTKHYRGLWD